MGEGWERRDERSRFGGTRGTGEYDRQQDEGQGDKECGPEKGGPPRDLPEATTDERTGGDAGSHRGCRDQGQADQEGGAHPVRLEIQPVTTIARHITVM